MKRRRTIGFVLILISAIFAHIETWYFGWNMFPGSPAEWACDSIAVSIAIIGWTTMLWHERKGST